jgi:enoyl-CoA hydratase/carnithine racemase
MNSKEKMNTTQDLIRNIYSNTGWLILNRPHVLNAISLDMTRLLMGTLKEWETNSAVQTVVIEGAGDKAFCAGGDVRAVYEAQKRGDFDLSDAFFREEYILSAYIHSYPKPYVALLNGITMGGGMGASVNGSHRIVTEKAVLAMPETGIGFFPDVGATTFLTRKYPIVGLYVGLTGMLLKACDALWLGLATHYVPSESLSSLKEDLTRGMDLEAVLQRYSHSHEEKGFLRTHQGVIGSHFNKGSLKDIFESLEKDASPFAQNTLNILKSKSPLSLAVTFRQLTRTCHPEFISGSHGSFNEAIKQEFRLSQRMVVGHDFKEGIRAVLVDKDRLPRWNPSRFEDITEAELDAIFAPLGEWELIL